MNAPANVRANLPVLIDALPSDAASAHNQFTRERQVVFLEALAVSGSVRSAARRAGVSHQTVHRAKRACRALRRCVDAALLCARDHAEEELRCRAVDGVEEEVLYHGEVVATRRRYCSRLLLAHLGRLDKLAESEEVSALAEGFDAALAAFGQGDDTLGEPLPGGDVPETAQPSGTCAEIWASGDADPASAREGNDPDCDVPTAGGAPDDKTRPEPCNIRSTPQDREALDPAVAHLVEPAFWRRRSARDPEFYGARWLGRVHAMLAARPGDAPPLEALAAQVMGEEPEAAATVPLEALADEILGQVLGYEYAEADWWQYDHQGRWYEAEDWVWECAEEATAG